MQLKKPIKSLKASMKEDKRYLLLSGQELKTQVEKSILEFVGVLGMSKTGLNWIKNGKDWAIIGVNREMLNQVQASFSVWSKKIEVTRVSGTLKGLKSK